MDKSHIQECLLEMLADMFGKECIGKMIRGNNISITIDEKVALVNVENLVCTQHALNTAPLFVNMKCCGLSKSVWAFNL